MRDIMDRKVQKSYIYDGFGFPINLIDVPMIKTRGEWTPDINYIQLQRELVYILAIKPTCLTGSQIKFIRKFFKMTLKDFGLEFGVSHVAVLGWEAEANEQVKINPATEKCIRLFILDSLVKQDKKFRETYHQVDLKKLAQQQKTKQRIKRMLKVDMKEISSI